MTETQDDHPSGYRVKFVDIRVKPPGARRSGRRSSVAEKSCEEKGCDQPGDCKAPKQTADSLRRKRKRDEDFHWFCQRHAAEYNRQYNFFDSMTEAEYASFQAGELHGHQRTWRFGTGPMGGAKAANAHDTRRWRGRVFFEEEGAAARHDSHIV